MLSEEGSESSNRFFRHHREHNSRQCSLEQNLLDLFQRSHHISDPDIQDIFKKDTLAKRSKNRKELPPRLIAELLLAQEEELQPPSQPSASAPMEVSMDQE